MSGRFITFEGGEGAGKSTQIKRLAKTLKSRGFDVVVTREPGGTPGAEAVRHVLLSGAAQSLGSNAEAMLFAAARIDHVDSLIRPALQAGNWVLCDRFTDSTRVYQGESGVDPIILDALQSVAVGDLAPDLTLILDVPPKTGLKRALKRAKTAKRQNASGKQSTSKKRVNGATLDRFEQDRLETHERRRDAFLAIARQDPARCAIIDANGTMTATAAAILEEVDRRFADDASSTAGADTDASQDAFASVDAALAALRSAR